MRIIKESFGKNLPQFTTEKINEKVNEEIDVLLKSKRDVLIEYGGINDLTKKVNSLNLLKKILEKRNKVSPSINLAFLEIMRIRLLGI